MPSIDQRVVEMMFDNKQFETGVAQSTKSLQNLKKELDLDKSAQSLSSLEKIARGFNISGIADGVDKIADKFSMLGVLGVTAMQRLANSALDTGEKLAKAALGFDDMAAGMSKYEMQTKAVQTITNATGKSVGEVEEVLAKLMKYTDETSYDFATMVSTIGKFTAAGVDLKVAENAMEGIANEAAKSGAGIQQANQAMYNFAQALSSGYVKLVDWKSISIANMSTKEFKEQLIQTAIEAGTLAKKGESVGKIMKQTKKATKKANAEFKETEVNFRTFEETLSEGWLTSDVLIKTLEKYSDTSTKFGLDAFHAAQEALTFSDAIQAVKDALSSKWMQSYKYLFGDLDEARALWTDVANNLYDFVSIFADYRNELLKGWHEQEGYSKAIEAASNIWETFMNIVNAVKDAFTDIIPPTTAETLVDITERIRKATESWRKSFGYLEEHTLENVYTGAKETINYIDQLQTNMKKGMKSDQVKKLQEQLIQAGFDLDKYGADGVFGPKTEKAVKQLQKQLGIKETGVWDEQTRAAAQAAGMFQVVNNVLGDYTYTIDKTTPRTKRLQQIVQGFAAIIDVIGRGVKFGLDVVGHIVKIFKPLGNQILNIASLLAKLTVNWRNNLIESGAFEKGLEKVKKFLEPLEKLIKKVSHSINEFLYKYDWIDSFEQLFFVLGYEFKKIPIVAKYWDKVEPVATAIKEFFKTVKNAVTGFFSADTSGSTSVVDNLKKRLEPFKSIGEWFKKYVIASFEGEGGESLIGEFSPGGILQGIAEGFASVVGFIKNIDFSQIAVLAIAIASVFKLYKTIKGPAQFIKNISELPKSLNKAIKGYGFTKSMSNAGDALKNMGIGIALLAASVAVLSQLDPGKAWSAVGIIAVLSAVLVGVAVAFDKLKIDFNAKKTKGMLKLAISLLIVARAVAIIGSLPIEDMLKGIIGMGAIMLELYLFSKYGGGDVQKLDGLIKIAGGIMGIAQSMTWIANLSWEGIAKGLVAMGAIMLELALFMKLTNGKEFKTGPWKMVGIGAAVMLMALSLKTISKLSWGGILKGLVGLGAVLLELAVFMKLTNGVAGSQASLFSMIGVGVAILLLATSLTKIAKLSWGGIAKGIVGLGAVMLELVAFMHLIGGRNPARQIALMLALVGIGFAITLFVSSLKGIAKLRTDKLVKGLIGLGVVFLEIAAFMKLIGGRNALKAMGNAAALIGIGVALNLIVLALGGLSRINGFDLAKGLVGLGALFLELAVFLKMTGGLQSSITALPLLLGVATSLLVFGLVLKLVANIPWTTIAAFGISLGVALSAISGAMLVLSAMPVTGALTAIANLDIFIANLVLVLSALNGLNELTGGGLADWLEGGAQVLGRAIGGFINGILEPFRTEDTGGDKKSLTDYMNDIVANLSTVMDNMKPFLDKVQGVTEAHVTGVKNLVSILAMMSGEEILDSFAGWVSGGESGSGFVEFAKSLTEVVPYLATFSNDASTIDEGNMEKVAKIMGYFKDVALAIIPMTVGEIIEAIGAFIPGAGDSPFVTFASKMVLLIPYIKEFAEAATGINTTNIESAASAMEAFGKVCSAAMTVSWAGFVDNILNFVSGGDSITSFVNKMLYMLPKLKKYGNKAAGINNTSIQDSATSLQALSDVANKIPGANGLVQKIFGEHDIGDFGDKLAILGSGLYDFYDATKGIPSEYSATGYVNALTGLAGVAEALPGAGGLIQGIFGEKSLDTFGSELTKLGEGLAGFATATAGIPSDYNIDGPVAAMTALANLESELEAKGGLKEWILGEKSLKTFGEEIASLGDDLATFSDSIKNVNSTKVRSVGVALQEMGTAMSHVPDDMTVSQAIGSYARGIEEFIRSELPSKFERLGEQMDTSMATGITRYSRNLVYAITAAISHTYYKARSYYSSFVSVGSYLASGLAEGIYRNGKAAIWAANALANSVRNAIANIWKVRSPSRVGMWMGEMFDAGIMNGIINMTSSVAQSGSDLAKATLDATKAGLATFSQSLIEDPNMAPTIRPVLDLSEVQAGAGGIGSYFRGQTIGVNSTAMAGRISRADAENAAYNNVNTNADLGVQISALNDRINQLDTTIANMKVVTETGALIGAIGPGIDSYLGKRQMMGKRGS